MKKQASIFISGLTMLLITLGCSQQVATKTQSVRSKTSASPTSNTVPKTINESPPNKGATQPTPTMTQICQSDALLLSHFSIKKLFGTPLPKACCAPGVLPPDYWQCELDWPSSDAPSCSGWQEMATALSAQLKDPPTWMTKAHQKTARKNHAVLKTWYQEKYGCVP